MFRGLSKLKSERPSSHDTSVSRRSSETKNELAITPPKRIIRALYPYTAQHNDELSFEKNSFFYVNEELSGEWYLAFDPSKNVKGSVPQTYFEIIQRQDQQPVAVSQAQQAHSRSASAASYGTSRHGFGSSRSSGPEIITRGSHASGGHHGPSNSTSSQATSRSSRRSSLTIYGSVSYDFTAERNDESTVAAGESIVIVAQSTEEWFVAKPIGRLGGPGLIPVSYVELREVGTDRKLDDVDEAIKRANSPQVEEWKRRLAEYKASSIPLGRFGNTTDQVENAYHKPGHSASSAVDGSGHSRSVSAASSAYSNRSDLSYQSHRSQPSNASYAGNMQHNGSAGAVGASVSHQNSSSTHHPHHQYAHHHEPQYHMNGHQPKQQHHGAPKQQRPFMVSASVDRFAVNGGRYWYLVKVELSDGTHRNLCRFYQDFYDFQIKLLEQFPEEAGRTGKTRTSPFMPGPLTLVTHTVSSQRRANLDDYVRDLIRMPPHISQSEIVLDSFSIRPGDVESHEATQQSPQPPETGYDEQYSGDMPEAAASQSQHGSYQGQHNEGSFQHAAPAQQRRPGPNMVADQLEDVSLSYSNPYLPQTEPLRTSTDPQNSTAPLQPIYGAAPGSDKHAPVGRSDIRLDQPTLKIKVFTSENVIAIRIPVETPFDEIYGKIKARLSLDHPLLYNNVNFRGDPINTAEDFARTLNGGTKIALYLKP